MRKSFLLLILPAVLITAGVGTSLLVPNAVAATANAPESSPRLVAAWDADWRFSKGEFAAAMAPGFADAGWRVVRTPHDWSTEEPFSSEYGSGNGYAAGGIGWYRKHFRPDPAWQDRTVAIEFDGVYANSEVWLNGQFVGGRPYGYSSFACELTPYLKFGGDDNVLAVRVDHSRFADSRWYTGSGIYRHVRLVVMDPLRIAHWGTYATTPVVTPESATVQIETTVQNIYTRALKFVVQSDILDAAGRVVAKADESASAAAGAAPTVRQTLILPHPRLWSLDTPLLYTLRSRVREGTTVKDETQTIFGVRTLRFDPDHGFALNGALMKLKGVCLHHDAGPLGAAVPEPVLERRLRQLKEIGVNAIRTSHNPPAPELLDLCDRLGLLVMDEAFDEFTPTKKKWAAGWNQGEPSRFGYGEVFEEWGLRDVQDMVRRDRNHPSIILWSVGNEIDYPNDPFSHPVLGPQYRPANPRAENLVTLAKPLVAAVKGLDPTRPVTAALASFAMSNAVGLPEMLDVVGYNYQEQFYAEDRAKHPRRFIFGSENSHDFPAWLAVRDHADVAGQFLWTGIDYLGEADAWPHRAAGFGLLDLCGFKKPLGWFRQSLWSEQPLVYLCVPTAPEHRLFAAAEHWNWPAGTTVSVACYTNCAEVELTLNGKSLGAQPRAPAADGVLTWAVPYEPGVLKAVGRANGRETCSFSLETAGAARCLALSPDIRQFRAGGRDICHLEIQVVDARGVRVPDAAQVISLEISGPAEILAFGNADLSSSESCRERLHRIYRGRGLAILESTGAAGSVTVIASAPGIESARVVLRSGE
jgi:beta-galactosidase